MRGSLALLAVSLLADGALVVSPAHAADPPAAADLRLTYDRPVLASDGSGIRWHWTLANKGAGAAEAVVVIHRVSAGQKVVSVSKPCTGGGAEITCRFGSIGIGEKQVGWIRTAAPAGAGTVRVSAQVTWRESRLSDTPPNAGAEGGAAETDAEAGGTDAGAVSDGRSAAERAGSGR